MKIKRDGIDASGTVYLITATTPDNPVNLEHLCSLLDYSTKPRTNYLRGALKFWRREAYKEFVGLLGGEPIGSFMLKIEVVLDGGNGATIQKNEQLDHVRSPSFDSSVMILEYQWPNEDRRKSG